MKRLPSHLSTNFVTANVHTHIGDSRCSSFGLIKTFIADLQRELYNFHYSIQIMNEGEKHKAKIKRQMTMRPVSNHQYNLVRFGAEASFIPL